MAEDQTTDGGEGVENIEREARMLGWVPREEFKGPETSWVDAETFVEKGRHILPIVQENNKRLMRQNTELATRLASMENSLKAANAAIETLQENHAKDVEEQVRAARDELKAQLRSASEAGDHAAVAEITEKMVQLNAADKSAGGKSGGNGSATPATDDAPHPDFKAWAEENPDFIKSARRVALAKVIAEELRLSGDTRVGREFLDAVRDEVEAEFGGVPRKGGGKGKVEGSNGGRGRSGGNGRSYSDLPAEAREACDRLAARLVGPGRAHKDIGSWRAKYAEKYFSEGATS